MAGSIRWGNSRLDKCKRDRVERGGIQKDASTNDKGRIGNKEEKKVNKE